MTFTYRICLLFLLLLSINSYAQIEDYTIKDTTVYDCKAFLHDDGWPSPQYQINEDYCFSIDIGTVSTITINFSHFNTEVNADELTIYDQLGCTGNVLLNQHSGNTTPPPVSSNTGYMSFYFNSDIAVAESGFDAYWTTIVPPPVPPEMNTIDPTCNNNTIEIDLTKNVICDSVIAAHFTLNSGSTNYSILNAEPVTCNSDSTNKIKLTLNSAIDKNCEYELSWNLKLADRCDSIYEFIVQDTFIVLSCPIILTINADNDTICPGMCTDLEAIILSDCINFNYTWTTLPNGPGPHTICPSTTTTYQVTAEDQDGLGIVETAQITIYIATPEIITQDTTVCQKADEFNLISSSSGGYFEGAGILDSIAGLFHPDTAGAGNHMIYYNISASCKDSLLIFVDSIEAGDHEAACKNSAPFILAGFYPVDGVWSGDHITPDGLFTPPNVTDSIEVTYTSNTTGCSHTKYVYIDSLITIQALPDSICESLTPFNLTFTPPGGIWSGPGIEDSLLGLLSPRGADFGYKVLIYELHGCSDTIDVFINEIDAGYNITRCPFQDPIQFTGYPTLNSYWQGTGVTSTGLFDPFLASNGNDIDITIYYEDTVTGCIDYKNIYLIATKLAVDTLYFCESDPALVLNNQNTGRTPYGNTWTGTGVQLNGTDHVFNPQLSGVGEFVVTYTAHTCSDSLIAIVYPDNLALEDTSVCSSQPPFILNPTSPSGGLWTGSGIIDSSTGLFDPGSAIADTFYVYYTSPSNCNDSILIRNYTFVEADLSSIDSSYCWVNNDFSFNRVPINAVIIGLGITGNTFNPTVAGAGTHTITSSYGSASCLTTDTISVTITPALETTLTISKDTICAEQASTITVVGSGGNPPSTNNYTYNWNENLFAINTNTVTPANTTVYTVTTSDGCSDPVTDTAIVYIEPTFSTVVTTSPQLCYGDTGWAQASVTGSSTYNYYWSTTPSQTTDSIIATAGSFINLTVTETVLGCKFDTLIKIPNYKPLKALFSVNPNEECIPFSQRQNIELIDLCSNAVAGIWNFSDKSSSPYILGVTPEVPFDSPGLYSINLEVENEGGCTDSMSIDICINDEVDLFIASAFSPNNDGINDMLFVRSSSIDELELYIYNRLGEKVFFSDNIAEGWDGQFRGEPVNSGVFTYFLKVTYIDGKKDFLKGDILLVR